MTKVVYNACYGGFNLSDKAVELWCKKKGWTCTSEEGTFGLTQHTVNGKVWYGHDDIDRHDKELVEVVEELGEEANGMCAKLTITEVESRYRVEEYDGMETVVEGEVGGWVNV